MKKALRWILPAGLVCLLWMGAGSLDEKITDTMVRHAAELFGMEFTQSEIDSMLPDLEDHRKSGIALRATNVENEVYPPLIFQPVLPGFVTHDESRSSFYPTNENIRRPEQDELLAFMSVRDLGTLIRTRQITSEELTRFFITRLKKLDPALHCVINLTEDRAYEKAREADAEIAAGKYRGPLHGIPYGAKDLLAARGYPTTWGATPFKDQVIDMDASVIEQLDDAGAVLIAKLSLGALAWGDVWYGETTRNPWDTTQGSSGSSAGSASAVAAGAVPFAIGSETYGSIVSPSTVCGTTGLRPTFGRVSRHGAMALSWSMDKLGPITRSALDCSLVLEAISGKDPRDPFCQNRPYRYDHRMNVKALKIGYVASDFDRSYRFKKQDSLILAKLREMGFDLIPVTLPEMPPIDGILSAEAAAAFDELTTSGTDDQLVRQVRNAWPNFFRAARFVPAVEYIKANRVRHQLMADMNERFREVDVILHPSWAGQALGITNYTGHPSIVIPAGIIDGKPTSISLTGKLFGEAQLVRLASEIQEHTQWDDLHPAWLLK